MRNSGRYLKNSIVGENGRLRWWTGVGREVSFISVLWSIADHQIELWMREAGEAQTWGRRHCYSTISRWSPPTESLKS